MSLSPFDRACGLVGRSEQIVSIRRLIQKAARNRLPVLLLGESGTGKEVVARAIHSANPRGQFVPIDCGSLVGTLMESELFGHARGAFSGAVENKKGLVELADGGTAFLDEIGDLPLEMQVKLLRLIQEREYRPVGALKWHTVDLRVIAATHHNLAADVASGHFRKDLYYRLNVFVIRVPPLREHKEDIPLLAEHFLEQERADGLPELHPGRELMDTLVSYDWPGNVRELKHCLDRMAALQSEGALQIANLPSALQNHLAAHQPLARAVAAGHEHEPEFARAPRSPVVPLSDCERQAIVQALEETHGERARAAHLLGIGRTTLYRKMKQYGIQ